MGRRPPRPPQPVRTMRARCQALPPENIALVGNHKLQAASSDSNRSAGPTFHHCCVPWNTVCEPTESRHWCAVTGVGRFRLCFSDFLPTTSYPSSSPPARRTSQSCLPNPTKPHNHCRHVLSTHIPNPTNTNHGNNVLPLFLLPPSPPRGTHLVYPYPIQPKHTTAANMS